MKVYAAFMLPKTLVRMDCTGSPFPFKEAPPHGPCAFVYSPGVAAWAKLLARSQPSPQTIDGD